tara:strand:- start:2063 stop:2956 length:894 start_codon:yes stop_codon:yes gene_type:complete
MEKDQIVLLKDRGLISINGDDSKNFLQNIITNDVEKVSASNTIFSALFTPQGKYLFEFFLIKKDKDYILDCDNKFTSQIISFLSKYKLKSKIEIRDISSTNVISLINFDKFKEIQKEKNENASTVNYRNSLIFVDPRSKKLGARILSTLEELHLTIKRLNLKIIEPDSYFTKAHKLGIPVKGLENLKDQLFGLEANFEILKAIDFKKGCYIGQENTARMKLKNKLRRRLFPILTDQNLNLGDELKYNDTIIGKVLINKPLPFALIKLFNPDFIEFYKKEISINNMKVELLYEEILTK